MNILLKLILYILTGSLSNRSKVKSTKTKKDKNYKDNLKCIYCLAVSTDGKFLVS